MPTNRSADLRPEVVQAGEYTCWFEEDGVECGNAVPEGHLPWGAINDPRAGKFYALCEQHRATFKAALAPYESAVVKVGALPGNTTLNEIDGGILISDRDIRAALQELTLDEPVSKNGPIPDEKKLLIVELWYGATRRARTEMLWRRRQKRR